MDDARMLVDGIHERVNAEDPTNDFWLNLLGTARLQNHTNVVVGAYQIREPSGSGRRHKLLRHSLRQSKMLGPRGWQSRLMPQL